MSSVAVALAVKPSSHRFSPAVSRSEELLSCAKTALKIAKSRHARQQQQNGESSSASASAAELDEWFTHLSPSDLFLFNTQIQREVSADQEVVKDGLTLLRTMEAQLKTLEGLVRRRGHTNDPTEEITIAVSNLEQDAKELTGVIKGMVPPTLRAGQRQRHWKAVQQWFQATASTQSTKLKEILQTRAQVLAEQARRRQRFQTGGASQTASSHNPTSAAANALFALPPPRPLAATPAVAPPKPPPASAGAALSNLPTPPPPPLPRPNTTNGNSNHSTVTPPPPPPATYKYANPTAASMAAGGVRGGYGSSSRPTVGYGGSVTPVSSYYGNDGNRYNNNTMHGAANDRLGAAGSGMRQRRQGVAATEIGGEQQQYQQQQHALLQRQQERQSALRLNDARTAEKSLAELGTVFGKMSTLVSQQSEVLEKVEDDVENAYMDVNAGGTEIQTLYSIKKGNRALILKVFGLLIFLIVFMKFYAR